MQFSDIQVGMESYNIHELYKYFTRKGMISFAVGLPEPGLFPVKELREIAAAVLNDNAHIALQYAPPAGYPPLMKSIARYLRQWDIKAKIRDILIVNGCQQSIDLTGKLFLNRGDVVVCEKLTYPAAVNGLRSYGCTFAEVETDSQGIKINDLERVLETISNVKLIYIIPDFNNPTGKTWTLRRRKEFIELVNKYDVAIIEDSAYSELRYEGDRIPPVKAFETLTNVIYTGTFSKICCPGLRTGWACADSRLIQKYTLLKQAGDLLTNTLSQRILNIFMVKYDFEDHLKKLKEFYKKRKDVMTGVIENHFPSEVEYANPEGGFFIWITLGEKYNSMDLLHKALEQNVAFLPGNFFSPSEKFTNTFRLCFSNQGEEAIEKGIMKLAEILKEFIVKSK